MQYKDLKNKAKKLGLRVTKDVKGKRVKLSSSELRAKITRNFENTVKNAQKVIKLCRTVVVPANYTPPMKPMGGPPPPKKMTLLNELKMKLKNKKNISGPITPTKKIPKNQQMMLLNELKQKLKSKKL